MYTPRDACGADRLFLLLFFAAGALAAHFRMDAALLLPQGRAAAALLLVPALLAGAPSGILLIPFAALLLGCVTAQNAETAIALLRVSTMPGLRALLPSLLSVPCFFLLALAAMRLSGECLDALARHDRSERAALIWQQLFLWGTGIGAAALFWTMTD